MFDSGIGGLSIAQCIHQHLPDENLIYVADSQFAPYGDKSSTEIIERVNKIADWLIHQQVKAIVVACNTATVIAIEQLRLRVSIPIIGVEPAIKPAALHSKTKKVALLVTEATAINTRFLSLVDKHKNGAEIYIQPCPGLVELIEQGLHQSEQCFKILHTFLQPLLQSNIDTLVLGCTHYPFVRSLIQNIVGDNITIMETAQPVTDQLARQLANQGLLASNQSMSQQHFFSSRVSTQQARLMSVLFGQNVTLQQFCAL
ncbi:glutamate racemase [Colwellia hornerae]|uniref:Glutamate racemase n=1 Tax=Colwellia hornerae TaxID=89402 RepID=A0A5C6Q2W3_9GAMM|nr:glutamate racemase [Colwellia hornerae]TWX54320.1 glutamate racemase [Colwellia hornerae]TWX63122.1 glutamate racemase [Colwellia hornerae]